MFSTCIHVFESFLKKGNILTTETDSIKLLSPAKNALLHLEKEKLIWAGPSEMGIYYIGEQWRLRRAYTSVQSRQSRHWSHRQLMQLEEATRGSLRSCSKGQLCMLCKCICYLFRGDATTGSKRRGMKYLDEANVMVRIMVSGKRNKPENVQNDMLKVETRISMYICSILSESSLFAWWNIWATTRQKQQNDVRPRRFRSVWASDQTGWMPKLI